MTKRTKLSQGEKVDSKKLAKSSAESSDAEKIASGNDNSHCVDCGKAVLKSQAGISCDICAYMWFPAEHRRTL